jgi:ATP-binding cassette subfamily F protein 3
MISAVNISLGFGGRDLFKEIGFRIGPHDRIGLVGSNGAGKSTLLKTLLGEVTPDSGEVAKAKYVSVGYLPQEGMHARGRSLYQEVESVFGDLITLNNDIEQVHLRMAEAGHETEEFAELLEIYGELQHKLEDSDAFRVKAKIEKVLMGLGFETSDFERATEEFSGGWQMRIALARLLLQQPSLLLLDEPTNHLDLDSLRWLEEYLKSYEGAIMIVSHDRRFLDTLTGRTFALSRGDLTVYAGNYSFYEQAREERLTQVRAAQANQQQQIKQTEQFIERFRYKATKARQVQSRIKQLEKLDIIEIEEGEEEIHFRFPEPPSGGRSVLELRAIQKSYGANVVFDGVDFDIDRGDRIAFVGINGAGKSTMSRIVAGIEPIDDGSRTLGHNIAVSYFAQHQADELNPDAEVLQTVDEVATGEIRKRLRSLLGSFLFHGDDVFKKVRVLSGGEKSRLALAKMLLQPANLLIMDEPTNHLDMRSKAVLQEALKNFSGSFVIVSHDRDFLDPLVNKVVEFKKGSVKTYLGNVSEYIDKIRQRENTAGQSGARTSAPSELSTKERKRLEAEQRQRRYERTRPIQRKIEETEQTIGQKEDRKKEIEQLMSEPDFYQDEERVKAITHEHSAIQKELTDFYYRWNELIQELERLNAD